MVTSSYSLAIDYLFSCFVSTTETAIRSESAARLMITFRQFDVMQQNRFPYNFIMNENGRFKTP